MDRRGEVPETSRRATAGVFVALGLVLLAGAISWHALADASYRASLASGTAIVARYASARSAAAIEPWNPRYTARASYVAAWLRADALLAAGDYKDAVTLLSATTGSTLAEPDLLELYRKAQAVQSLETNRKAHLQHAHEGPGGTLAPGDVER